MTLTIASFLVFFMKLDALLLYAVVTRHQPRYFPNLLCIDDVQSFPSISISLYHNFLQYFGLIGHRGIIREKANKVSDDLLHISRTIRLHLYHSHILQLIDGSILACLAQEIVAAVDL